MVPDDKNLLQMPFYKVRNTTVMVSNSQSKCLLIVWQYPNSGKSKMKNIEIAKIPNPNEDVPKHPFYLLWKLLGLGLGLSFGQNSQTQIWLGTFFVE